MKEGGREVEEEMMMWQNKERGKTKGRIAGIKYRSQSFSSPLRLPEALALSRVAGNLFLHVDQCGFAFKDQCGVAAKPPDQALGHRFGLGCEDGLRHVEGALFGSLL
ncbi:hypothetical protein EYF80_005087 [Liparis tanakae]|uniref:Uncharacterized protein n=1 Tax=Liparis tanakae TaxID=230148 RepID=A0A4Z2J5B1_9TELE|nr:hypothetical protein EYF80_005087 [Liparis tanakae]